MVLASGNSFSSTRSAGGVEEGGLCQAAEAPTMNVSAGSLVEPLHDQQEKVPSHLVPLLIAQLQAPLPASVGHTAFSNCLRP
jgi:hypothetical protein